MAAPRPTEVTLSSLQRTFISGCHILHHQGVLDAYGHLSFRHPTNPTTFIMSRYIAPGTISSPDDLVEYHVATADPVSPTARPGYSERAIHSELYRRFPAVHSVVHSHSEDVVPFSVVSTPLRPVYHMAGFLGGGGAPVFDIAPHLRPGDTPDMLVRNTHLGAALAACFSSSSSSSSSPAAADDDDEEKARDAPDHAVVLMRGHGLTVVAPSIEDAVLRAVYTQKNAAVQTRALALARSGGGGDVTYLSDEEAKAAAEMTRWSAMRPWRLWLREVEAADLYVNMA